jgi:hypothetical protein
MNRDYHRLYRALEPQAASDPTRLEAGAAMESAADAEPLAAALLTETETPLLPEQVPQLRHLFETDPEAVQHYFAELKKKPEVSAAEAAEMLDELEAILSNPGPTADALEATASSLPQPPPPDFTFDLYDPQQIPIDTSLTRFEEKADWRGYALAGGLRAALFHAGLAVLGPFRFHHEHASRFNYRLDREPGKDLRIALFSDFANGYYHSRYLAARLAKRAYPYAIHLGDVYYAGKSEEVVEYLDKPMRPVLDAGTELFLLAGNHEMYSKGRPWLKYLDKKRNADPARQRQEGTYFRLLRDGYQLIGIDTEWFGHSRYDDKRMKDWLGTCLAEARAHKWTTILLSSNEPYCYGGTKPTRLFADLQTFVAQARIDLWFWGNTHYCALFQRNDPFNFYGSCIGHGGFPYERERAGKPTPAPLLFLETDNRFGCEAIRPDRGNHGYCELTLGTDKIELDYIDWMGRQRHRCVFGRNADGKLTAASSD